MQHDLSKLEGTDVRYEEAEDDSLVFVIPRYKVSEGLRILKAAGLIPESTPFMYV